MGGRGYDGLFNNVFSSTDGQKWKLVKANNKEGFSPRDDFGVAVLKSTIYLAGGFGKNGTNLGDVWSSTDGKTWKQLL